MTSLDHLLRDLAVVLVAAGVVAVLFHRLRWPIVAGYLLAGLAVGPHLPPALVADAGVIRLLSELGVILLMFSLGLDFRLRHLARLFSTAGITAGVEVGLMLVLGYGVGQALGWTPLAAFFAAGTFAISSTMIVARIFGERAIQGGLRDTVLGTLVFEDLAAMLLIAVLTASAAGETVSGNSVGLLLGRLALVVSLFLVLGMLVIPRAVRLVAALRHDEMLVVSGVGLCFGFAWLAHLAGFSVAMGAFLAGAMAAESGLGRVLEERVQPVRDVFAAIFFVAVGMQLDPAVLRDAWPAVLLFALLVIAGKTIGVTVGAFLAGRGTRESVQAGLSLAQVGEFSFLIAGIGVAAGAAPPVLGVAAVTVSVLTGFLSPVLIDRSAGIAAWVDRRLPRPVQTVASLYGAWIETLRAAPPERTPWRGVRRALPWLITDVGAVLGLVVLGGVARERLAGFAHRLGATPAATSWIATAAIAALVAPFLFGIVRVARGLGGELAAIAIPEPPPGRVDNGRAPRRTLAVALQIAIVLLVGGPLVVVTQAFVPGLAGAGLLFMVLVLLGLGFWRTASDLLGHFRAGAELVVSALAKQARDEPVAFAAVRQMLPGMGDVEPVRVGAASPCAGRTLGELNLRGRTGATVVAVLRGEERVVFPEAAERLLPGEFVALTGSHDAVAAAAALLGDGPGDGLGGGSGDTPG